MKSILILLAVTFMAACVAIPRVVRADDSIQVIEIDPDSYGAIAYSMSTGKYGYSYNYEDRSEAEQAAVNACKAEDARAVTWVHNGFCALAIGKDRASGHATSYGSDATSSDAMNTAIAECKKQTTTEINFVICLSSDGQYIKKLQASTPEKDNGSPPASSASAELEKKIYQSVKDLQYSDQVASDFVQMVRPWKCDVLYQDFAQLAQDATQKKISSDQYAQVEEVVVSQLAETIRKQIAPVDTATGSNWQYYDLAFVIMDKKAHGVGYAQLFYILGNSIGVTCRAVDVAEFSLDLVQSNMGQAACEVDLRSGKAMQVDLTLKDCVSKPFSFANEYTGKNDFWELNDKTNRLNIRPRIQLLDRNGLVAVIYRCRGYADVKEGRQDKAIVDLNKAIELNPKYAGAYYSRASATTHVNQRDKAISDYTKAIELDPKYVLAYYNRGSLYTDSGQRDKAISDYTKAIELNPKYTSSYYSRGLAYDNSGDHDKAISDYSKVIELDPTYVKPYLDRGTAYYILGQFDKAISDFTKVIELSPIKAGAYTFRGFSNAKLGKMEDAKRDLQQAIQLNPGSKDEIKKMAAEYHLDL